MSAKCREKRASGPFSRLAVVGRHRAILLTLALSLLAAAVLSACGGEDSPELLPGETASEINANLSLVEDLVANGDCVGAENAAAAVSEQVESLTGVDQKLQEALAKGAVRLREVIGECEEAEPEEEETTVTEEPDPEELEKQERNEEKAQERAEKEEEKEQKQEEKPEKETPSKEPPGQKEQEETEVPPTEPTEPPSGGVSPSTEAGGAE
jgi:outer membrane biosynthesis protein TonB